MDPDYCMQHIVCGLLAIMRQTERERERDTETAEEHVKTCATQNRFSNIYRVYVYAHLGRFDVFIGKAASHVEFIQVSCNGKKYSRKRNDMQTTNKPFDEVSQMFLH
jgi:hypothetical protein